MGVVGKTAVFRLQCYFSAKEFWMLYQDAEMLRTYATMMQLKQLAAIASVLDLMIDDLVG
ncbi:MAG: hypothetical protein KC423_00965 [Anaerolineales bacterium]|nr:hypothetical protein [Anaerolineales bacterium]